MPVVDAKIILPVLVVFTGARPPTDQRSLLFGLGPYLPCSDASMPDLFLTTPTDLD